MPAPTKPDPPSAHASTLASDPQPADSRRSSGLDTTVAAIDDAAAGIAAGGLRRVSRADYVRGAELARGGMGRIVAARDVRHDRPVALKELLHASPAMVARFRREALIAARLQHPAIVPIYEAGVWEDGEPFFAMKQVEGRSLDAVILSLPELRDRLALLPKVIAVTEALAYAHARGVIHRDLKPHNVLVGDYGETVVIDWGLAKDLSASGGGDEPVDAAPSAAPTATTSGELTVAGHALGTPAYMPPEQARGEEVDARADVYALGAMLYHLLSGQVPYGAARTARALLDRVATVAATPLSDLMLELPADLVTIVDKAMARDPAERYRDAAELAADLRRYAAGHLVAAHSYSSRALLARWARRHRALLLALAMLMASAVVGVGLYIRGMDVQQAATERERRRAEEARAAAEASLAQADARTMALLEEQGAARLTAGQPLASAAYLAESFAMGNDSPAMRHMLGAAAPSAGSVPLRGHRGVPGVGGFSGDGSRIVTADASGTVRVFDAASGAQVLAIEGAGWPRIAVAATGTRAAALWDDGGQVFDVATGKLLTVIPAVPDTLAIALAPDGGAIAVLDLAGSLRLLDGRTAQPRWTIATVARSSLGMGFSSDGRHLLIAADQGALIHRASDGGQVLALPGGVARFDASGAHVIALGGTGDQAVVVDLASGRRITLAGAAGLTKLAVSPRGALIATASLGAPTIDVWDGATGRRLTTLTGHDDNLRDIAFDPATGHLVSASWDRSVRVWDAGLGRQLGVLRVDGVPVAALRFSADGARLCTSSGEEPRVWSLATIRIARLVDHAAMPAYSPDGAVLATLDGDAITLRDPETGVARRRLDGGAGTQRLALDRAGARLVAGNASGRIDLWDLAGATAVVHLDGHTDHVASLTFLDGGAQLLTTSVDRTIRRWDLASGALLDTLDTGTPVFAAVVTPDQREVIAASGTAIDVWDLASRVRLHSIPSTSFTSLAISPDGATLLATGYQETAVFDLATRSRRATLVGHVGWVQAGAFSRDGALIVTAGKDGTVRVWSAATGRMLDVVEGHDGAVYQIAVRPDRDELAVGSDDGTVRLWALPRYAGSASTAAAASRN